MSGWSARRRPNALRWAACQVALATPQRIPAAVPMTQSSRVWPTISMIVGTPAAGLADELRPGAVQLDLARRVGAVAELVLQALQVHGVAGAVGQDARQREARQALGRLRQDEEEVAHRRRAEPLVAGQDVLAARPAAVDRLGHGRVGAHVRAALLLGHRHATQRARLAAPQLGVVARRRQPRLPLGGDLGLRAQRGHSGERHRDRAGEAALGLRGGEVQRRARSVGGGLLRCRRPRQRVQLVAHPEPHEVMPRAVKLHLVDAVPIAVEGLQARRVLVGLEAPADRVAAPRRADLVRAAERPTGALALERLDERKVVGEQVAALQRWGLVGDLVGVKRGGGLAQLVGHARKSSIRSPKTHATAELSGTGEAPGAGTGAGPCVGFPTAGARTVVGITNPRTGAPGKATAPAEADQRSASEGPT